jgi:hypothetical protein
VTESAAGLPPMAVCRYCGNSYPAVGIAAHESSCPSKPAGQ